MNPSISLVSAPQSKARLLAWGLCFGLALSGITAHAQFSVSDSGTPTYSQAIAVPPGVAGMSPKLSLFYAGGGVNGPLGHGWSTQGISSITRCPATIAIDGKKAGVAYGPTDKLCLDGQRLIQTDESGNPAATQNALGIPVATQTNDAQGLGGGAYREYRTEKDTYARIRAYGYADGSTVAGGPAYFKAWTKSGQIYEYGYGPTLNATALITPFNKTMAMVWAVARVSDTLGNYIDFKYQVSSAAWGSGATTGREWNIAEIQYSGNKVIFNYGTRTIDGAEAYQQGNKNVSTQLLQSISTYVNASAATLGKGSGVAVKTTWLTYDNGPITRRARLKTIQECAGDVDKTRCLPSVSFAYTPGGDLAYQANSNFNLGSQILLAQGGTYGVLPGDFTGTGRTGLIRWVTGGATLNQLWLSDGTGHFTQATNFNITDTLFDTAGCFQTIVGDLDGNGLPDLLRYSSTTNIYGGACAPNNPTYIYLNQGNGSFTRSTYAGPTLKRLISTVGQGEYWCPDKEDPHCFYLNNDVTEGDNFFLLDIDGDGKLDLITTKQPAYHRAVSGVTPGDPDPCLTQICTHVYKGDGSGGFGNEITTTSLAHTSIYVAPVPGTGIGAPANIVDLDGNGLADLAGLDTSNFNKNAAFVNLGNGSFTPASYGQTCTYPLDYNGDGRNDCLVPSATASANALQTGNGTGALVNTSTFNLTQASQELSGPGVGIVIGDFNGEGRHDILRWKDDATKNALYLSGGDGSFSPSSAFATSFSNVPLKKSDGSYDIVIGDFTGRGNVEILRLGINGNNLLYTRTDPSLPDQLQTVTTGSGAVTQIVYLPLSNAASGLGPRYTGDRGTANAASGNQIDVTFPMYVVSTTYSSNGIGSGLLATEYAYSGLKADTQGRGLLGFRQVSRQSFAPDGSLLTVVTQYLQGQPYTGVARRTETYLGGLFATGSSPLLSRTINVYCDQTAAGGAQTSATETAPCPVSAKIQRPYVYQTTETGWDLSAKALPQVVTTNTYNGAGDPLQISVTTSGTVADGLAQTATKTTTNTYLADNTSCATFNTCAWVLGRLSRASVQSTVPNSLGQIITWGGGAPYATATNGTPPAPPPNSPLTPAQIQVILGDD